MHDDEDLTAFSFDDEYDEVFSSGDAELAERDVESGSEELDGIDDEIYREMFEEMPEDALEAEAKAVLAEGAGTDGRKLGEEEMLADL